MRAFALHSALVTRGASHYIAPGPRGPSRVFWLGAGLPPERRGKGAVGQEGGRATSRKRVTALAVLRVAMASGICQKF